MNKKLRKILVFLTMLLVVVGVMMLFFPTMMLTAAVTPTLVDPWDPSSGECERAGAGGNCSQETKIEPWSGNHSDGPITTTGDSKTFSWSSTKSVCFVIVKAGTGAYIYAYPSGSFGDSGLVGPEGKDISHVTFCWDPVDTTTTTEATTTTTEATTTTTEGTTTTTEGTTTTTEGTTTTTEGTTTTTEGTTTTTEGTTTTTEGTTTTTEGTTTTTEGTTTTTTPTTQPTTTTTSTKTTEGTVEVLALTGFNSLWYVAGSVLIALGIIMGTFSLSTAMKRR